MIALLAVLYVIGCQRIMNERVVLIGSFFIELQAFYLEATEYVEYIYY